MRPFAVVLALLVLAPHAFGASAPEGFPRFSVPGQEGAMESLREMFWLHYRGAGPKATIWDAWLPAPSLWPATGAPSDSFRRQWASALSGRILDAEGYVATHQHGSIAHPLGWPFPYWNQGAGGAGWHFSFADTIGPPWRQDFVNVPEGWVLDGARDAGMGEHGWRIALTGPRAAIVSPPARVEARQGPFVQVRWRATGLENARAWLEWEPEDGPKDTAERRMALPRMPGPDVTDHAIVSLHRHPLWNGTARRLRLVVENAAPGAEVTLQAIFTQYDTRHNVNAQSFIDGCSAYFNATGDLDFLRANIGRMRMALRYVMTEHEALSRKMVVTTSWVGHDGRAGFTIGENGAKTTRPGRGVGNNYWDLLPFGGKDAYATLRYYAALGEMAALERAIAAHPEWSMPGGPLAFDAPFLERHAAEVKRAGNVAFWNAKTGRFVACVDEDGRAHDYGFTFLNLEAIHYGFATDRHAREIMGWISGRRTVAGDTSTGPDIYRFRFGPRATTRRNVDWYGWFWGAPETIPWGGQVQDGGAVLGFTYHDLMSRLRVYGPSDAWRRLCEIAAWFDEVRAAGGYRAYYANVPGVTLQGGGTAGGLGLDYEFFESVLAPQVMLDGFLGYAPTPDGFRLDPRLPDAWPSLTVDRIRWRDLTLTVRAEGNAVVVSVDSGPACTAWIALPRGWRAEGFAGHRRSDGALLVELVSGVQRRFTRGAR